MQEISSPVQKTARHETKENRREEKLNALRQKREKALSAQSAAEKKTKDITAQIAKIERDIHNDEVKILDDLCMQKGYTYAEIASFLEALSIPLNEAAELLNK